MYSFTTFLYTFFFPIGEHFHLSFCADCCVFSLSYSLSFTGFIMFGFVGFFVKLVL